MLNLNKLFHNPKKFARITGIKYGHFLLIVERMEVFWSEAEEKRLERKDRVRAIGGGRNYKLATTTEKVFLILFFYRYNITHALLGFLFDLDASNVTRLLQKLTPLFEKAADPELKNYLSEVKYASKKANSYGEFFAEHPAMRKVFVDATEQRTLRPSKNEDRKAYFSGKKKMFSIKTQICINENQRILDISDSFPGAIHDKKVFDLEVTPSKLPHQSALIGDLGYFGAKKDYPDTGVFLPYKRKKNEKTLSEQKSQFNQELSRDRVKIENVFCRMKKFEICSGVYRGDKNQYRQMFRNVAALVNLSYCSI